jgi:hypothetical protein
MSVIRSALDKSWPLGSGFSRKPSFAEPLLTWPKATVTALGGAAVSEICLAIRIDEEKSGAYHRHHDR